MKLLEDRILSEGKVLPGGVLKIDGFLNHRLDVELLDSLGKDVAAHFSNQKPDLVLTVEASGIAFAVMVAKYFGCRVLVAKKHRSVNIADDVYTAKAFSFTHKRENTLVVSKEYLQAGMKVLVVDDFLASGSATVALLSILEQAGATPVGIGIAVEKSFQGGREKLESMGLDVYSLARIADMDETGVKFVR